VNQRARAPGRATDRQHEPLVGEDGWTAQFEGSDDGGVLGCAGDCERDAKSLAVLPEKERAAWQKLWADIAALRKKVQKD